MGVIINKGNTLIGQGNDWVAPSDWIQLPEPNDNEILLLASDINPHYALYCNVTGGYTVNWGDGTVNNFGSGVLASHSYTVGSGQVCSRGYITFKIRIYAQTPANQITNFYAQVNSNVKSTVSNGFLWAKFGTQALAVGSMFSNRGQPLVRSEYLESVSLPSNMTSSTIDFSDTFKDCFSLKQVIMPKTANNAILQFDQGFNNTQIMSVDLSAFQNTGYCLSPFRNCVKLKSIIMPKAVSYNNQFGQWFNGAICEEVIMPPVTNTLNAAGLFDAFRGKSIIFNATHENKIVGIQNMFSGCNYLTNLVFVNSIALTNANISGFMNSNWLQRSFRFPDNTGVSITTSTDIFVDNYNIETISNFPPMTGSTNIQTSFRNCYKLKNIDNLEYYGDTVSNMNNEATYAGCYSLNPVGGLKNRNKNTNRFILAGADSSNKASLQALLFTNPSPVSTWAGTSPQIDVSNCSMDATALNALFTSIIATSASFSGKTIRVTGNVGASTCDTTIITNVGGVVNKTT